MRTAIVVLVAGTLSLAFIGAVFYIVQAFAEDQVARAITETHRPADASTGSAGRCTQHRPHRIIPDDLGWKCANECGERWYIDEALDNVAMADIALWELENQWEEA